MTAIIHHEARHDHLALVFAERERRGLWKPAGFAFPRAIETRRAETLCGSVADESAARQGAANPLSKDHPHAR